MAESSWAWRLPTVVQCILPSIVMALIMFFPETPRWLLSKDRREEAIAIMAKYHGEGDPSSPIVQLQLHEITEDFSVTRNDNPWWEFRELFNSRGARYRLAMVICMAFFGQWSGNNVVSYFMPGMSILLLNVEHKRSDTFQQWSKTQELRTPTSNCSSTPSTLFSVCWLLSTVPPYSTSSVVARC